MNAAALDTALNGPQPPLLLHVLPAEHFAARRIGGAKNACVYEMTFLDAVRALVSDHEQSIVVYGEGAPSFDSEEAASHLRTAGYINVADFRGGLREWEAAGLPIVSEAPLPSPAKLDGIYLADVEASVIRWTGRNLFNHHQGHLSLADGRVEWRDGALQSAAFTIELGGIVCEDLTDPGYNAMLIRHLRSADFFDVEKHPTAQFATTRVEPIAGATEGTPNFQIAGDFTLRAITREIAFPAVIAAADADHVTAQAVLEIDRTRWGSRYGSGKFFAFLGRHVVNDHIALHLKIQAARE
jgi:polyisoprenoid-binding protein YceI